VGEGRIGRAVAHQLLLTIEIAPLDSRRRRAGALVKLRSRVLIQHIHKAVVAHLEISGAIPIQTAFDVHKS